MSEYRLIVLGLGGIGSAAAYWAARRLGDDVLGIEQFEFGHRNGGSEDHSRIIRLSYHTPGYVELAGAAYAAWADLESDSGEQVVLRTGGLDLAPEGATIGLGAYRESMAAAGVPFEELDAREVMARWPQWQLGDDVTALYQEQSGIVMAHRANRAHRRMAVEHGATLVETTPVTAISYDDDGVTVEAGGESHRARSLIVAAGAWTNSALAHLGVSFPLEVSLEQVVYLLPVKPVDFSPDRFPIWIWMTEPSFYGFPVFGEPAVKIAWDRCQVFTDADDRSHEPLPEATDAIREFTRAHLPGADGALHLARTCLYTLTPDRDFVIDRVPGTTNVYTAVGAGHAYKFASLIGRLLTELALDGESPHDLTPFRADRAILREPDPVRTYMV